MVVMITRLLLSSPLINIVTYHCNRPWTACALPRTSSKQPKKTLGYGCFFCARLHHTSKTSYLQMSDIIPFSTFYGTPSSTPADPNKRYRGFPCAFNRTVLQQVSRAGVIPALAVGPGVLQYAHFTHTHPIYLLFVQRTIIYLVT